jgi:hypothetical protein
VGDFLRRDVSGGTRPVFNDKWLPQSFGKPLADQPCENVGRTAGGKSNDNTHWPRRIGLTGRDT